MKKQILSYSHAIVVLLFGAFFIYAGVKKFIPKDRPANEQAQVELGQAVSSDVFEKPDTFKLTMKSMKKSGFLKVVGVLQILAGLLMILPRTRLIGLGVLLPITANIFLLHLLMDNRMDENIETGIYLLVNLLLILYYVKDLKCLLISRK